MCKTKFFVIGMDDNRAPSFPPEVQQVISRGSVFSGGTRHYEIVKDLLPAPACWIPIVPPLAPVFEAYRGYAEVVVFASGDPLFFGFANTIRHYLPEAEIRVYPVFNSLQKLAHELVIPYHDMRVVSLTGRPWHEFDRALIEQAPEIGVLTDRRHTPAAIAQRMLHYGYTGYRMQVGEHLGNPARQRIRSFTLEEAANADFDYPNNLLLTETRKSHVRRFGIPDELFEPLDGRPNMITKMPMRLLSLSMLELPQKSSLWDIGFCTGSVSIEAKLQFPHLHVTAFEIREEGSRLMECNSRRFGAPGITAVTGDFLMADLTAFPAPDAVFIGGHGGKLGEIIERVYPLLPSSGTVVFNSVSPESRAMFTEGCRRAALSLEQVTAITVDRHNKIEILKAIKR